MRFIGTTNMHAFDGSPGWQEFCIHCGWIPIDEHDEAMHGPSERFLKIVKAKVEQLDEALRAGRLK